MRDMTEKEMALRDLVNLLAPVLSESRGMAARDREERFEKAITTLCGPLGPTDPA